MDACVSYDEVNNQKEKKTNKIYILKRAKTKGEDRRKNATYMLNTWTDEPTKLDILI